jgi:phage replication-related protein YjqB (UPF0714/DUF867 family)
MADLYANFAALAAAETDGVDYRICRTNRGTPVAVIAPHGGLIEPGSSQIAWAIARDDWSVYGFEGLLRRPHGDLHITSPRFDEPRALSLVRAAETAVGVHGRADANDPQTVWMGGLDFDFRDAICEALEAAGFDAATGGHRVKGREPTNICNRGRSGAGAQLEIPRSLRDQLMADRERMMAFTDAVRAAVAVRAA